MSFGMRSLLVLLFVVPFQAVAAPDAWILSLGWSPQICDDSPGSREFQCLEENYFRVHGLQPLFRGDAPACTEEPMSDVLLNQLMLDLPNRARLRRVWKEQGACSGLSAENYAVQFSRGARRLATPAAFTAVHDKLEMPAADIKAAFVRVNPELTLDSIVLQCRRRYLSEVQVCVDANFQPRTCGVSTETSCKDVVKVRPIPLRKLR